jgi:sulfur-oxidizing protein SoxA
MRRPIAALAALLSFALGSPPPAMAQSTAEEIAKYRAMLADDSPAELWIARGEDLWKQKRGPKSASLEACDLGLGPGVVKGAYVKLPRYFPDTNKVQDVEQRLSTCMVMLQGFTEAEAKATPFGSPGKRSDMEALVAWIASESRGMKIDVSTAHPLEREAYEIGKRTFFYRAGPYDFACSSCHGEDNKRIRLQDLPNLTNTRDAQRAYAAWPAYRVSQGELRTMQHRLWDCFRQQRFPEVEYASDLVTALTLYLAKSANGGTYAAPAVKR